jgi:4,5-DOPA dioxygenase extradiol
MPPKLNSDENVKAPAVFISHGSPMVAIERGPFQDALAAFGRRVDPNAIVAISAHWGSSTSISISAADRYETIHDFGGFPPALYQLTYSPPGSPELAHRIAGLLKSDGWKTEVTTTRGLDHGVWIPLRLMYPEAGIPVVQLSGPLDLTPQQLCDLGKTLKPLRAENIMILGSGGIVHNLRLFRGGPVDQPVEPWVKEFDDWFEAKLKAHKIDDLIRYQELAPHAALAVPTFEHFAPVFIVLGATSDSEKIESIFEGFQHGALSMRSFAIA